MEIFVKIVAFAIASAIATTIVKRNVPEISTVLIIVACALLFGTISGVFETIIEFINELSALAGIETNIIGPVLKVCAISILARIGSDICKDSGNISLAGIVELCASVVAIAISMPLLNAVIELVTRM